MNSEQSNSNTEQPTANSETMDPEIIAMGAVYNALKGLEADSQTRILQYIAEKLKIAPPVLTKHQEFREARREEEIEGKQRESAYPRKYKEETLEGVSPFAVEWMSLNGLQPARLSTVFNLGLAEIDLVAKNVPGKNRKQKMRSVFLLEGVAAYLGTGAARFTHEQVKKACLQYGAYDADKFAAYLKRLSGEVSGSKDAGYTLTSRGLANATELVKTIIRSS